METVSLKTGKTVPKAVVMTTMISLGSLMPDDLLELAALCKNKDHKLTEDSGAKLKALSLVQADGRVHDAVREIVLSSIESDDVTLTLHSPIVPP